MSIRGDLLTQEENEEFERISKVKQVREDVVTTSIVMIIWVILFSGSALLTGHYDMTHNDLQYPFIVLMIIFLFLSPVPILMARRAQIRAEEARDSRVTAFKERINYKQRLRSGHSGGGSSASRRQMQHEWYGDNPDLGWQDRERAEMFGLDVETYRSNVLENDRD